MKKNEFMEGAVLATLAIIISKIVGLIYVIPFNHIIGTDGGALYGYAYKIYDIFLIISSAGIPLAISKLTSEYNTLGMQKEKTFMFKKAKQFILIFSIISFAICFFGAPLLANLIVVNPNEVYGVADVIFVIRCVSFAILVVPLLSILRGYLQGHKFIASSSLSQVIEQLVRVAIIIFGSFFAIKVFHVSIPLAVGIAILGACAGALIAYLYLFIKVRKAKKQIEESNEEVNTADKKKIYKKIIFYCIPFIAINISNSLYNFIDMILVKQGLNMVGYSGADITTISSIFTTWSSKLASIVTAFATGLAISLIPSIVESYTKKDQKSVNNHFNKILQTLLFIILPIGIFMSIFSTQIWPIFFQDTPYGPDILRVIILLAILDGAYIMVGSALQGLSKTKLIYTSVLIGLGVKTALDIPMMLLFDKMGIAAYHGAMADSFVGYLFSIGIPLIVLNKKYNFSYKETIKSIPRLVFSLVIVIAGAFILRELIFTHPLGRLKNCLYLSLIAIILMPIYYLLNKKLVDRLLGDKIMKRFKRNKKATSN